MNHNQQKFYDGLLQKPKGALAWMVIQLTDERNEVQEKLRQLQAEHQTPTELLSAPSSPST